jgi:arginine deiminase
MGSSPKSDGFTRFWFVPGLAHSRLTPSNCDDLLFDDVLWVQNSQRDHFDFIAKMRPVEST